MKPDGPIKLVSQLLDLPLLDSDGELLRHRRRCRARAAAPGKDAAARRRCSSAPALMRAGCRAGRCGWCARIAGDRITRVPIDEVRDDRQRRSARCPGGDARPPQERERRGATGSRARERCDAAVRPSRQDKCCTARRRKARPGP